MQSDMHEHFLSRHAAFVSIGERKGDWLGEFIRGEPAHIILIPSIDCDDRFAKFV